MPDTNVDATETKGKHTGDRWFVGGVRQKIDGQQALGIFWYDEANKRDVNIASVWYDPRSGDGALDASLIAAAPDLLAALNGLLGLVQLVRNRDDLPPTARDALTYHFRIDDAFDAIAKAAPK